MSVSMTVARRVYVPDKGKREKATLPNGQYVSLGVIAAAVDDDVIMAESAVAAEAAVVAAVVAVAESINSRCIAFRLVVVVLLFADEHGDDDVADDSTSESSSTTILILAPSSLPSLTCFVRGGVGVAALLPNDPNAYTPSVMTTAAVKMRRIFITFNIRGESLCRW